MRAPEFIVKIAADNINRLRRVDVFRVLENCSREEVKPMARYIVAHHPEFADEIRACWPEVWPEDDHRADSDCVVVSALGVCAVCLVDHSDPCPVCGARGFHPEDCPFTAAMDATVKVNR